MMAEFHAIGRAHEVRPFAALGAKLHEVDSLEAARSAMEGLKTPSFVAISEEFAEAASGTKGALVVILPGKNRLAVEATRRLVLQAVGVDLVARAESLEPGPTQDRTSR